MFYLKEKDILNLKYLLIGTKLLKREHIVDIKDRNLLFKVLSTKLQESTSNEFVSEIIEKIENETFYQLRCFYNLHKNGGCPRDYENDEWGINLSDESILIIRLHENLTEQEFFYVLETFLGISERKFLNLEMDFDELKPEEYLPKLKAWLIMNNNPFVKKIEHLIHVRSGEEIMPSPIEESMDCSSDITNESAHQETINCKEFKGICLVISNEDFIKCSKRFGTIEDEQLLKDTFSNLNFDVRVVRNLKAHEMKNIVESIKSEINENHEMFILFVLSHGKPNIIISCDEVDVPFEEFWNPFRGSQCLKLITKPKLFFFVCCQGYETVQGVKINDKCTDQKNIQFDGPTKTIIYPDLADFFFGYSTYTSFKSFRSTKEGTFYVKYLCNTIKETPDKSISDIHMEVQNKFSKPIINESFQTSFYSNLLRKPCYLNK